MGSLWDREKLIQKTDWLKISEWTKPGALNLGFAYPYGYVRSSQGVRKFLKMTQNKYFWVELLIWGVRQGDIILIWGYAEGYNLDLAIREYQKVEKPWSKQLWNKNLQIIQMVIWSITWLIPLSVVPLSGDHCRDKLYVKLDFFSLIKRYILD